MFGIVLAALVFAVPAFAREKEQKQRGSPDKFQVLMPLEVYASTDDNNKEDSDAPAAPVVSVEEKETPPVPPQQKSPTPAATTSPSAATSAPSTVVKNTPSTPPTSAEVRGPAGVFPQQLNNASGANLYAQDGALTPFQTAELLLLSLLLGVLGCLCANAGALANLYAWFARTIGVKVPPVQTMQSRHI